MDGVDVSGNFSEVSFDPSADVHDVTNFGSNGSHEFDPGLRDWEFSWSGFYDSVTIGPQAEALIGTLGGIISVFDGTASTLGDTGLVLPKTILTKMGKPVKVADMVHITGALKPPSTGPRAGDFAKLLHPLGAETTAANTTDLDNAASSANGGRGNLHVTAVTGTWDIKIQHSPDNSTWADLITWSSVAVGALTTEVSGTVDQYLRALWSFSVSGSVTFVTGFARY